MTRELLLFFEIGGVYGLGIAGLIGDILYCCYAPAIVALAVGLIVYAAWLAVWRHKLLCREVG